MAGTGMRAGLDGAQVIGRLVHETGDRTASRAPLTEMRAPIQPSCAMPYAADVHPLLRKLNARPGVGVTVLDAPPEVEPVLEAWATDTVVRRKLGTDEPFVLGFVRMTGDVVDRAPLVVPALADDAVLWFAYPKKSSRQYRSDVSQMQGWQPLGDLGFEAVRQVSIDADWSALRFRRTERIATLRRRQSMAMSAQGKQRVAQRRENDPPGSGAFDDG
ncbi:MAG: hypothetical protein M3387_08310 [Actinomycetota bacterium]|nr:hypothetical protein [Actinomycetota bacterium]